MSGCCRSVPVGCGDLWKLKKGGRTDRADAILYSSQERSNDSDDHCDQYDHQSHFHAPIS
jgi:hypothetical protein